MYKAEGVICILSELTEQYTLYISVSSIESNLEENWCNRQSNEEINNYFVILLNFAGEFGTVYKAQYKKNIVAVKILKGKMKVSFTGILSSLL